MNSSRSNKKDARLRLSRAWLLAGLALVGATLACAYPGINRTTAEGTGEIQTLPPVENTPPAPQQAPPLDATQATESGKIVLYQPFAIILAFSGPETGLNSILYTPLLQASQMAAEDHGMIHGFGVNVIAFHDECSQAGGADVAAKVAADDRIVALLGPVCPEAVVGALPILEQAGIVMITAHAGDPGLGTFGPSVFHRTLLDDDQAKALGYPSQIYIEDLPSTQAWINAFEAWGGMLLETGHNHFAPYQYDATRLLLEAIENTSVLQENGALVIDREAVRAAVRATAGYSGVTGMITFEPDGDRAP